MKLCSRCNKRPAVVFMTRLEGDKSISEGLCLNCARDMKIPQIEDLIQKMGLTEEDLERFDGEIQGLMEMEGADVDESDEEVGGKTPPIDFNRLFGGMFPQNNQPSANQGGNKENGKKDGKNKNGKDEKKHLGLYCRDLTSMAREGKLDRTIGRDKEIARLMQILCRRQKNNPCLIGEPGVGKTAIAEALATRIAAGDVPVKLANKEVHLLDLTALVAGTQFRGQFESRIKGLIEEVRRLGNIILVIDEVHSIVGAGDAEGGMNAANILKPALSRGEIQVIGATTLAEYRKYIEKDAALERRFQPIIVEEPSIADSIEILKGIKGYYETFHGIKVSDHVIERAVILSERYITDRFLPDKAIDLLDESSSYLSLNSAVVNRIQKLEGELTAVRGARETIEASLADENLTDEEKQEKYKELADAKSKEYKMLDEFKALSDEREKIELTVNELAYVIELWTGVPASNITELEFERIDKLSDRIKAHIVGQDEAVDAVVRAIKRNRAGVSYKRKPVSFIFAGPTGVGKTELVKTIARDLFSTPENLIRLDMSEFMEKHSVSRIVGSPPGYVGYDDAGQLTEKIRRKPYSVVLFDEIEKAHPDVMNILLQILDDGRITDAHGRNVNFENTIIVMTTNAGSTGVSATPGFLVSGMNAQQDKTEKALSAFLRPEFLNRIDEIITFRQLSKEDFKAISKIMLDELKQAMSERGTKLEYTDEAAEYIARNSYSTSYGARNMRRYIQKNVEDEIANHIIGNYNKSVDYIGIGYDAVSDKLDIKYIEK